VYEELGEGFTLIALDAAEADVDAFTQAAQALRVPLTVVRDDAREGREAYGAQLILVRPDQYVVWTGAQIPADTRALIGKVVGRSAA
jgi:hypothetical protein